MPDVTQEEYFKRVSEPRIIEDTHGWQLQSLYSGYALYRGGVGIMSQYKRLDYDVPEKVHNRERDRMLVKLSKLIIDWLFRKKVITLNEKDDLFHRVGDIVV